MTSKTCTPPTRPPTGLESSVLRPSTARSRTSRPTRSTSHDWIIQSHYLTQPATNDPGGLSILMGGSFFEEAPAVSEVARPLKRYLGAATERRGWLHRLPYHSHQVVAQCLKVCIIAQLG